MVSMKNTIILKKAIFGITTKVQVTAKHVLKATKQNYIDLSLFTKHCLGHFLIKLGEIPKKLR